MARRSLSDRTDIAYYLACAPADDNIADAGAGSRDALGGGGEFGNGERRGRAGPV